MGYLYFPALRTVIYCSDLKNKQTKNKKRKAGSHLSLGVKSNPKEVGIRILVKSLRRRGLRSRDPPHAAKASFTCGLVKLH